MDRKMEAGPPALVERIVRMLVPPLFREHVLGDLAERYVSPRRYLFEAARTLPFLVASRVRSVTNPGLFAFQAFYFWFAAFGGAQQERALTAVIPTLAAVFALKLRDVYRTLTPRPFREAAIDMLIAALSVVATQGLLMLVAPAIALPRSVFLIGFPFAFFVLFFARWQILGAASAAKPPRSMSSSELLHEITAFQTTVRRNIRIEIGACVVVAAGSLAAAWLAPNAIAKAGYLAMTGGAGFIAWYLARYLHPRTVKTDASFADMMALHLQQLSVAATMSRNYLWFYVLPLTVGPAILLVGAALKQDNPIPAIATRLALLAFVGLALVSAQASGRRGLLRRIELLAATTEKS